MTIHSQLYFFLPLVLGGLAFGRAGYPALEAACLITACLLLLGLFIYERCSNRKGDRL